MLLFPERLCLQPPGGEGRDKVQGKLAMKKHRKASRVCGIKGQDHFPLGVLVVSLQVGTVPTTGAWMILMRTQGKRNLPQHEAQVGIQRTSPCLLKLPVPSQAPVHTQEVL